MFCPKCNTEQLNGAKFCSNCGGGLVQEQVSAVSEPKLGFFNKYIVPKDFFWWKKDGVAWAIILGIIMIASAVGRPEYEMNKDFGWAIIIGALAYRSARNRMAGIKKNKVSTRWIEAMALLLVLIMSHRLIIVPAWIFTAYTVLFLKNKYNQSKAKRLVAVSGIFVAYCIAVILFSTLLTVLWPESSAY